MSRVKVYSDRMNDIDFAELLKTKCSKYLDDISGGNYYVKGSSLYNKNFGTDTVYKHRSPVGSLAFDRTLYNKVNEWLISHHHCPRNNSIITTSDIVHANKFGRVFYIFPIGEYKYTYIKCSDFNIMESDNLFSPNFFAILDDPSAMNRLYGWNKNKVKELNLDNPKKMEEYLSKLFVSNKNLKLASNKFYETWFSCESFYYVDQIHFDVVISKLL